MSIRLGILGGGQLALYLCDAARTLGMPVSIFSDAADDPALPFADKATVGRLDDAAALDDFLGTCDVITFDKEGIPDQTLAGLLDAESRGRIRVRPGAGTLLMLKDKALQKSWMQHQGLPTLPFHTLDGSAPDPETRRAMLGKAVVQKTRCGGYDGRGVQILECFQSEQQLWDVPSIVEPLLRDAREISVLTVRDCQGNMQTFPPVSMDFDPQLNAVKTVSMPAALSPRLSTEAVALAQRVVSLLEGVGVFAMEMFVTPDERLLINEISPRVHNSGHVTLEACNVSQFEQHVRAVAGLPLIEIKPTSPAVMLNILYDEAIRRPWPAAAVRDSAAYPGAALYWYGKAPGKPGRKMGHINARGTSVEQAAILAGDVMACLHRSDRGQAA